MDQDVLMPYDCEVDELPSIDIDAKEVRYWLRDNLPGTELPCGFNTLVSYASNNALRPYINQAGTWPTIVKQWAGWAWENGYKDAGVRLVTAALFNTNATADQSGWMDMYCSGHEARREVMREGFKAILPAALHQSVNGKSHFFKNISGIMQAAKLWCTRDCIESMSDEQVLTMLKQPCSPEALFHQIVALWLNHPELGHERLNKWTHIYHENISSITGAQMARNVGDCAPYLDENIRHQTFARVAPGSNHRLELLKHALKAFKDNKQSTPVKDVQALYEGIAEVPFEVSDTKDLNGLFDKLQQKTVWDNLEYQCQRRLAVLVAVALAPASAHWANWYNGTCGKLKLPEDLFSLVGALELKSWPELVSYHETKIAPVELPDFNADTFQL